MAKPGEQFYTDSICTTSASFRDQATISRGDSTPKHVGGEWKVPCTIRDATAIGRQSVCWPAQQAYQPYYRKLRLSMAASWLSLARHDAAIDNLLASWDMAAPVKTDGLWA